MLNLYEVSAAITASPADLLTLAEIDRLERFIEARRRDEISEAFFLKARLQQGIYAMRGRTDGYMIRVRAPLGRLTEAQLERLALVAERYADGRGHITTRQDIQLYSVTMDDVPAALRELADAGLTTRETAGNVVRSIAVDPLAGISPDEVFDVRPYADQVLRFFLRNPLSQNLPRKLKIAFSGSLADRAMARIHDIGGLAAVRLSNGRLVEGFELYVGGGLGAVPVLAQSLEPFTPADLLLPTLEAIVRIFDRLGNRENKARARLKFLVETIGLDAFRQAVWQERDVVAATTSAASVPELSGPEQVPPGLPPGSIPIGDQRFNRWVATNVVIQKQPGYAAAYVTVPAGDLSPAQFRTVADLVRDFGWREMIFTATQNLLLPWVPLARLPKLYESLAVTGLAAPEAQRPVDPVGCAGASTCPLAITTSHTLAQALTRRWSLQPARWLGDDLAGVSLKISGCPNSCGHHHVATIGLYGASRKVRGRDVPHYNLLLGGRVGEQGTRFGQLIARIPARSVPEALEALVDAYRCDRQPGQPFTDWINHLIETNRLKSWALGVVGPFQPAEDLADLSDWGQQGSFEIKIGANECAA